MESFDRPAFVSACDAAFELASDPAVAAAWDTESACPGMTVGGLTHHLLGQIRHIAALMQVPPTTIPPIPLLDHYDRAAWVSSALDDEANTSIRDEENAAAADGPAAVLVDFPSLLELLPELVTTPRSPDTILIPWQGWTLTTDDFFATRSMELVVHSDDLAASVGLPTPEFPEPIATHAAALLAGIAMRRHGQAAVVRALSRPQRAPGNVSAF
ncbi:MAG: maleylpyruvate isomerase N-terminal domain-containing protein [Aeromicrobium sp.]